MSEPTQRAAVHLHRREEDPEARAALAADLGGPVGLSGVLGDLDGRLRRTWAPGRAVRRALAWERADSRDRGWWPQGISSSAEAAADPVVDTVEGRRLLVTTWYSKAGAGARVSFVDLDSLRYRHVLLVRAVGGGPDGARPGIAPVTAHAGGIVWDGPRLHVAATRRGFHTFDVRDILRVPEGHGLETSGHRYVLPMASSQRGGVDGDGERLRHSFLSLDREAAPPHLLVGEYGSARQTRRLARFLLDAEGDPVVGDDGLARALTADDATMVRSQGVAVARGRHHVTASQGPWTPGTVYVGGPGDWRAHRFAVPMGPEDLTWWPSRDELWTLTEHPGRRWLVALDRAWFDRR
ncbi:hypothetical protein GHK92_07760 [Nocardioides sp. dk4132]|uniref:hypothetical protein n=1 Tax=unclassified Nocardioides TaxID=2615069 RepID=UPI001295CBC6|nr:MULTISPECIES: hypothetical protein [unclassified Nocardioides]MQW75765.1 hypothetical protein [Nocardioides sp. dk4132]QGA08647.1 hypothetical protein GFH29_15510 [Nocardioides sp. dk884]